MSAFQIESQVSKGTVFITPSRIYGDIVVCGRKIHININDYKMLLAVRRNAFPGESLDDALSTIVNDVGITMWTWMNAKRDVLHDHVMMLVYHAKRRTPISNYHTALYVHAYVCLHGEFKAKM